MKKYSAIARKRSKLVAETMKNEALVRNVPKTRKAILVLHSESLDETESFKSISTITDMYNCCTTKPTPRSVHKATHTSCKIHPFWDNIPKLLKIPNKGVTNLRERKLKNMQILRFRENKRQGREKMSMSVFQCQGKGSLT